MMIALILSMLLACHEAARVNLQRKDSEKLVLTSVGRCEGTPDLDCQMNPPPTKCLCACEVSEDNTSMPLLALEEARTLVELGRDLQVKKKDDDQPEELGTWAGVCTAIAKRRTFGQHLKDFSVKVGGAALAVGTGAALVGVFWEPILSFMGLEGTKDTINCLSKLMDNVGHWTFKAMGLRCRPVRKMAFKWVWQWGVSLWTRKQVFSTVKGLVSAIFEKDKYRKVGKFLDAFLGMAPPGSFQFTVVKNLMRMLEVVAPWLLPVSTGVTTAVTTQQVASVFLDFLSKAAHELEIFSRLRRAQARQATVSQCLAEVENFPPCGEDADCEQRQAEIRRACHDHFSDLSLTKGCDVDLVNADSAHRCEVYGTVGQPPAGAFVKSLGIGLFQQGLRACNVIQRVSYVEGGTFGNGGIARKLGLGEKTVTVDVGSADSFHDWLEKEHAEMRNGQDEWARMRGTEIAWLVTLEGQQLDLSSLPATKWVPFTLTSLKLGGLDCANNATQAENVDG